MQGEGSAAEQEISFEFHRQRFCYNNRVNAFEKLKYPTRVSNHLQDWSPSAEIAAMTLTLDAHADCQAWHVLLLPRPVP